MINAKCGWSTVLVMLIASISSAQSTQPFDGSKWNISTGNLSVGYIRCSPIGAAPQAGVLEAPPDVTALRRMKDASLVAYEDYFAWGAEEREPGKWDWTEHDRIEKAVHAAGLKYVAYNWIHFPPVWLRDGDPDKRTLMKCLEHGKETNYLSIFDPRTIEYYDHFYKNLAAHFGDRLDGVYACILGPYGEGNYPLNVPDWVNIGHCHEGYWCGDEYALRAFRTAMQKKYGSIEKLNDAWNVRLTAFDDITPPKEISENFVPKPQAFPTGADRRRWLDFITWYHQAIIDFAEKSIQVTLKYFPKEKVRTKPGGNAGGVNPIAWGTYCPGYAKMAGKYGIVLQPADCQGAYFGDKWLATAYQFYHVKLSTEPAGNLDEPGFVRRMFSDASCGAAQLFTYQFEQHAPTIRRYVHLLTGKMGDTQVAVLCPTTLYRLGGNLHPTIESAKELRDVADFDVLDELLVSDGALTDRYKALVIFQPSFIEKDVLKKISEWQRNGGKLLMGQDGVLSNVEGTDEVRPQSVQLTGADWIKTAAQALSGLKGVDGKKDGLWTTFRGSAAFVYNTRNKDATCEIDVGGRVHHGVVPAHQIWEIAGN